MSTNPFEPPRTSDLEGGSGPGAQAFSEAALQELSASAVWVRWFARVTAVSMTIGVVEGLINVFGSHASALSGGTLIGLIVTTGIAIAFLGVLRGYAAAAERLREGTRQAAIEVVFAQSAYFKFVGVLTIIGIVLIVLALVVGLGEVISAISRGLS